MAEKPAKSSVKYSKSSAASVFQYGQESEGEITGGLPIPRMQEISHQIETATKRINAGEYVTALRILQSLPNHEDDQTQLDCEFLVAVCETMTEQVISEETNGKIIFLAQRLHLNWKSLQKMAVKARGVPEIVHNLYTAKLLVSNESPDIALSQIDECTNRSHKAINTMITKGETEAALNSVSLLHAILEEVRKVTRGNEEITHKRTHSQAKCLNKIGLLYTRLSMHGTAIENLHEGRSLMENFFGIGAAQYNIYSEMAGNIAIAYAGQARYIDATIYCDKAYKNLKAKANEGVFMQYRQRFSKLYQQEFQKNLMKVFEKDAAQARTLQQSSSFRDSNLLPGLTQGDIGTDRNAAAVSSRKSNEKPDEQVHQGAASDRQSRVETSSTAGTRKPDFCDFSETSGEAKVREKDKNGNLVDVGNGIYVDHTEPMQSGCKVYKGMFQGEEVAVKRTDYNEKTKKAIEVVKSLKRHHNVLHYKASGEWESKDIPGLRSIYIAMELCEKNTLRELAKRKSYTHKDRLMMLRQVIDGICHLHSNDVIHGELRPDRILRSRDGRDMKVSGAGLTTRGNATSFVRGIENETLSKKSDVYSAGLIFYYVLSGGERPLNDHNIVKIGQLFCEDACAATELITRMTDKDPEKRPNAEKCRDDMLFWNSDKKIRFILDFYDVVSKRRTDSEVIQHVLQTSSEIVGEDWIAKLLLTEREENKITETTHDKERKVDDRVIIDMAHQASLQAERPSCPLLALLHFIKQRYQSSPGENNELQAILGDPDGIWSFFDTRFPELLTKVHLMTDHLNLRFEEQRKSKSYRDANVAFIGKGVGGNQPSPTSPATKLLADVGNGIQVDHTKRLKEHYEVYGGIFEEFDVAVKRLKVSERSEQEVEIMKKLRSHPNIVEYKASSKWESVETPGVKFIYLAMELCGQDTLYELAKEETFTHQDRVQALSQITRGVLHMHENNIVHRDLKPQNILRSSDANSMKVADFGISKMLQDDALHGQVETSAAGTEEWRAPESEVSKIADVYSLGLVFLYVLSGGTLRAREGLADLKCPDSDIVIDLVSQMLQLEPALRPNIAKVKSHPIFMNNIEKLQFCCKVSQKCQVATKDSGGEDAKKWVQKLVLSKDEQARLQKGGEQKQDSTRTLVADKAKDGEHDENSKFSLLAFMSSRYQQFNKEGDLLRDLFGSEGGVWDFFSHRFPKLFMWAYRLYERQCQSTYLRSSKNQTEGASSNLDSTYQTKKNSIDLLNVGSGLSEETIQHQPTHDALALVRAGNFRDLSYLKKLDVHHIGKIRSRIKGTSITNADVAYVIDGQILNECLDYLWTEKILHTLSYESPERVLDNKALVPRPPPTYSKSQLQYHLFKTLGRENVASKDRFDTRVEKHKFEEKVPAAETDTPGDLNRSKKGSGDKYRVPNIRRSLSPDGSDKQEGILQSQHLQAGQNPFPDSGEDEMESADTASKTIGVEGGKIEIGENVMIVPPGAVLQSTHIKLTLPDQIFPLPEGYVPICPIVDCEPSGIVFLTPVTMRMRTWVSAGNNAQGYADVLYMSGEHQWRREDTIPINSNWELEFQLRHFSPYLVVTLWESFKRLLGTYKVKPCLYQHSEGRLSSFLCVDDEHISTQIDDKMRKGGHTNVFPILNAFTAQFGDHIAINIECREPGNVLVESENNDIPIDQVFATNLKSAIYFSVPPPEDEAHRNFKFVFKVEKEGEIVQQHQFRYIWKEQHKAETTNIFEHTDRMYVHQ